MDVRRLTSAQPPATKAWEALSRLLTAVASWPTASMTWRTNRAPPTKTRPGPRPPWPTPNASRSRTRTPDTKEVGPRVGEAASPFYAWLTRDYDSVIVIAPLSGLWSEHADMPVRLAREFARRVERHPVDEGFWARDSLVHRIEPVDATVNALRLLKAGTSRSRTWSTCRRLRTSAAIAGRRFQPCPIVCSGPTCWSPEIQDP
jgi:hypothetical protein